MNSEIDYAAVRQRVEGLIEDEKPFAWAKRIGLSGGTFDRFWKGGGGISAANALKIARAGGVSVDWLLTGEGPRSLGEVHGAHALHEAGGAYAGNAPGDKVALTEREERLVRDAVVGVEEVLAALGKSLGANEKAAVVVEVIRIETLSEASGADRPSPARVIQLVRAALEQPTEGKGD